MFIDDFLLHLSSPSSETRRAYRDDVMRFLRFLNHSEFTLETVTARTIELYMQSLNTNSRTGKPLAAASMSRRLTVVSTYLDYLYVKTGGAVTNHIKEVRRPKIHNVLRRALSQDAYETLMAGITNVRDKALIALYVASGLRLEEARQLDLTSISRHQRTMPDGTVRTLGTGEVCGKGGRSRRFFIDESTLALLLAYMRVRGTGGGPALFLSNRKLRLSRRSIQDILDRWCIRLGLPHAHIHACRHAFATNAVNHGMSSLVLQELMGHQSFTVTQRYFSIRPERVATEYFAVQESLNGQ